MSILIDPNEANPRVIKWLNENVLMGFTGDRERWVGTPYVTAQLDGDGTEKMVPWFAYEDYSGGYNEEVPVDAVEHLFRHNVVSGPVFSYLACDDMDEAMESGGYVDDDGQPYRKVVDETRKAILHPETAKFYNIRKSGYQIHQFNEWLVDNVALLLDDDLAIGSAGLLNEGGVAWVSVELPETIETDVGFAIRPRLLAYTSHDSTHTTNYLRTAEIPVCSNSMTIEIKRDGPDALKWSSKHSGNSTLKVAAARDTLKLLHQQADDMVAFFTHLSEWEVTNKEFKGLMNALNPIPEQEMEEGKVKNQRSITNSTTRRADITTIYVHDERAAPWMGTALGVLQAFNTYEQYGKQRKGNGGVATVVEKNMLDTLSNDVGKFNTEVLGTLAEITEHDFAALGA